VWTRGRKKKGGTKSFSLPRGGKEKGEGRGPRGKGTKKEWGGQYSDSTVGGGGKKKKKRSQNRPEKGGKREGEWSIGEKEGGENKLRTPGRGRGERGGKTACRERGRENDGIAPWGEDSTEGNQKEKEKKKGEDRFR